MSLAIEQELFFLRKDGENDENVFGKVLNVVCCQLGWQDSSYGPLK
jgi:hypothetical protein